MSATAKLGMEFGQHVLEETHELLMVSPKSLSEMERRTRELLVRVGQFLLGAWLMLQEGPYPAQRIACPCGGEAQYVSKREAVLFTVLGRVVYRRAYYVCAHCHRGCCPLDERFGLRPGQMSAELESLLGMTGASMPFAKGSDLFERLTLTSVSPQTTSYRTLSKIRHETNGKGTSLSQKSVDEIETDAEDAQITAIPTIDEMAIP